MKLVTWNVNGLRAIEKKGFASWFRAVDADLVCLQEIKATPDQLSEFMRAPDGYQAFFEPAQKPGYSGVVTYARLAPRKVWRGMGWEDIDREGRILVTEFAHFTLVNAYMPHARRDLSRKDFKLAFCERFLDWVQRLQAEGHRLVICGDVNVSHTELDLTHAKTNRGNAGFLPEERQWFDALLALGLRDVFRDRHPGEAGHHTWWSNRKGVREKNVGWRIDYFLVAETLASAVRGSGHQAQVLGSDHCPVWLELEVE